MLYLLLNIFYLNIAIVKRVVLIFNNVLYKSPLLLLLSLSLLLIPRLLLIINIRDVLCSLCSYRCQTLFSNGDDKVVL